MLWINNPTCAGVSRAVTKRSSGKGKLMLAHELTFLRISTTILKRNKFLQRQNPR